jgi:hypothetical protein
MSTHPIKKAMAEWLPEFDFGLLQHGFAPHGRDYELVLQAGGTYALTLTHVVELHVETRVRDDVWPKSWDDVFLDMKSWEAAGQPDGYVWGSNWSLAYPGLEAPTDHPDALRWSERLGKSMHFVAIETDRLRLSAVFHDARSRKLSDENSPLDKVLIPL